MAHNAKITPLPQSKLSLLEQVLTRLGISPQDLLNEEPCGLDEACKILNRSRETVVSFVKNDGLPGKKMGRDWEFYPSLVRAWRLSRQL